MRSPGDKAAPDLSTSVGTEPELREQRASFLRQQPGRGSERVQHGLGGREPGPRLVQLAHDDAGTHPPGARRERHSAEQRAEERRLAGAVRPEDRDALGPSDLEVEGTETERAALDHGAVEPEHHCAAPGCGRELEVELPPLPRLVHDLEPFERAVGDLHL